MAKNSKDFTIVKDGDQEYKLYKAPIDESLYGYFKFEPNKPQFTFNDPTRITAKWSECDFAMSSYMGYKLFLKNNEVGQLSKVKAMRVKV